MPLRIVRRLSAIIIVSIAAVVGLLFLASCNAAGATSPSAASPSPAAISPDQTITLGDIDPDEPVPRQLVSLRPGLDPTLALKVRALLSKLDRTEGGRQLLERLKKTRKLDPLPPTSEAALKGLKTLMKLVSE